jgi:hypothetical protein
MPEINPVRPTDLAYVLDQLRKNPKPSKRLKAAIAKCEDVICIFIENIKFSEQDKN